MTEEQAPYKTMATDGLHIASDYGLITRRLSEELQVLRAFRDAAVPLLRHYRLECGLAEERSRGAGLLASTAQAIYRAEVDKILAALALLDAALGPEEE